MLENLRLSFQGIWAHKMRSFLTMLGIIIGIASIISIVSTIKGTNEQLKNKVIGAGNNLVSVVLYNGDFQYDVEYNISGTTAPALTKEQKKAIRELEDVTSASFYYGRLYLDSVFHENTGLQGGRIYGIDEDYLETNDYLIQAGRGFVDKDYDTYRKVALLDESAATSLFDGESPLGKTIEIKGEPFVVVGVVKASQNSQPDIESISDYYTYFQNTTGMVLIPNASWPIVYQYDEPENAVIKVKDTESMSTVGKKAADILNQNLNVATSLENLQSVSTSEEETEEGDGTSTEVTTKIQYRADDLLEKARNLQDLSRSTNAQLLWIASISLLVGGIGVMNIMLVSVTERTSEIGLKKAIGARKRTILLQFLTEAAVLTSIGGVVGVFGGLVMSQVVHRVSGTPTAISGMAIVGSVVFSTAIGLIFGLLPSVKASNLNPIDALRSE